MSCGTKVLIKRAKSQAKKKTKKEKCIQKLFLLLLLDGIRFIQEVKEGPDDPPILWINANKYSVSKQFFVSSVVLFVAVVIGHLVL